MGSGGRRITPEFFLVSKLWREGVDERERGVRIGACSGYGAGFKLHNLFWRFLNF
jgi:hypothetical protein